MRIVCVILCLAIFLQYQSVTDAQTLTQTNTRQLHILH